MMSSKESDESNIEPAREPDEERAAPLADGTHMLRPVPRLGLRIGLCAAPIALSLFAQVAWYHKLGFAVWMAFLFGTYYESGLSEGFVWRRLVLAFVPLRIRKWSLEKFRLIETEYHPHTSGLAVFLLGGPLWFLWRAFDWLFPWIAGSYLLLLRGHSGKRVQVWQGNFESDFEANVDLLKQTTGLKIGRK